MKKAIVVLILVSICGALFAATLSTKAQNELNAIKIKSSGLGRAEKQAILDSYEKGLTGPLLLNIFLGMGIGSFAEGDTTGGFIELLGQGAGIGLVVSGALSITQELARENYSSNRAMFDRILPIYTGALIYVGFRVYGIIRAITYTKEYNRRLADALGAVRIGVVPVVDNDGTKLALAAKVSF